MGLDAMWQALGGGATEDSMARHGVNVATVCPPAAPERPFVTSVTLEKSTGVTLKPRAGAGCTHVTSVTPKSVQAQGQRDKEAANDSVTLDTATVARLSAMGLSQDEAQAAAMLAQRQIARQNQELDDRVTCWACASLRAGAAGWRCGDWRHADLSGPAIGRDLMNMLQRCAAWRHA